MDIHDTWTWPEIILGKLPGGRYKGKFKIGHAGVGHEVYRKGGNPRGNNLEKWLGKIAEWSRENKDHPPITVFIDIKKDLIDANNNPSEQFGLLRLNQQILNVFKNDEERLVTYQNLAGFYEKQNSGPTIWDLRDKIFVVLMSFHGWTYEEEPGEKPNFIKRFFKWVVRLWKRSPLHPFFDPLGALKTKVAYQEGRSQSNKALDPICCVAFNPQDRGEPGYEDSLEEKSLFVTPYTPVKYTDYISQCRDNGLIVRSDHKKRADDSWPQLPDGVNFPVTDHWKDDGYRKATDWVI